MAINKCTITGSVQNLLGSSVQNCEIVISVISPFFHGTTWVSGEIETVQTDASGGFSVSVIETASVGQTVAFTFRYYDGSSSRKLKKYTVVVPNTASALLSDLVTAQTPIAAPTYPAASVTVAAIPNLAATTAQAAFAEHQADIDGLTSAQSSTASSLTTLTGRVTTNETNISTLTTAVAGKQPTGNYITALTGDVSASGPGSAAATIANLALSKLASLTVSKVLVSDASGVISASSIAAATLTYLDATSSIQTQLNGKQATGNYMTALTGDVTAAGPGSSAATIAAGAVTDAKISASAAIARSKLAALTASRVMVTDASGVDSVSTVTPTTLGYLDISSSLTSLLAGKQATGNYVTALTGDVTASGPGSVAATIAANAVTNAKLATMATGTFKGNVSGSTASPSDLTGTQVTAALDTFTSSLKGLVPASGGGTTNFLRADGTFAAPPSAGNPAVTSKSANYTATSSDEIILCSAGTAFTITLPASPSTGKVFRIKKTDSSFNAVTIAGTIDGVTNTTINTQGENLVIVYDGSGWQILERRIPSMWVAYTPSGNFTNGTYTGYYRRVGDSLVCDCAFVSSSSNAGNFIFKIPTGLAIDTTKMATTTNKPIDGQAGGRQNSSGTGFKYYVTYSVTDAVLIAYQSATNATAAAVTGSAPFTMAANDIVNATFTVPISGWNG